MPRPSSVTERLLRRLHRLRLSSRHSLQVLAIPEEAVVAVEAVPYNLEVPSPIHYHPALVRMFLLVAVGLQTFFGTGCWTNVVLAHETPADVMSKAPEHDPHKECARKDAQTSRDEDEGDLPCLGHCLSEATQRAATDASVQIPTIATLTLDCDPQSPMPTTEQLYDASVLPCSLSPPSTETVVLRQ
ncbi:MAG: hypothetical protein PHX87_01930 [Candidatus Peribacteraceae bacterium]|nr:hypothetical protein [Candidatus Peribacteraceae bacterium]MDD5742166.1 hypothetical protein [Candidatus Peribacteraceae bacterium]